MRKAAVLLATTLATVLMLGFSGAVAAQNEDLTVDSSIPDGEDLSQDGGAYNGDFCEFPAQSVQLQRSVGIAESAPQVIDVQRDVCGNVTAGYTEQMTRSMNSTAWTPYPGM